MPHVPPRARAWLSGEVDGSSLAAFRVLFGVLGFVSAVRFVAIGWVDELLVAPTHHLHYPGFAWVAEPPRAVLYALFAAMAASALGIAAGAFYRAASVVYFVAFTWVELVDRALYLNHYYAVTLLAFLALFLPLGEVYSVDARLRAAGGPMRTRVPRAALVTVQLQLGLVYFFAGAAKLHPDWWRAAEPMHTWLLARADMPVVGPLFRHVETAYAMSWAGLVFDLVIPFVLFARRTRAFGYGVVVIFHLCTSALFAIGMFPYFMIAWTLVFFEPDWPKRAMRWVAARRQGAGDASVEPVVVPSAVARTESLGVPALAAMALWFAIQLALPLRHLTMPGDVLWTHEGFDFAWHVMVMDKGARAELVVVDRDTGERFRVPPERYYTPLQIQMMSENPALVVEFARVAARDFRRRGHGRLAVYARSYAALPGGPLGTLVDPRVDLLGVDACTPAARYVRPRPNPDP